MSQITIHETDPHVIAKLKTLADAHGRSIEDEAQEILREAVSASASNAASDIDERPALGDWWVEQVRGMGEIPLPSRADPPRELPFGDES